MLLFIEHLIILIWILAPISIFDFWLLFQSIHRVNVGKCCFSLHLSFVNVFCIRVLNTQINIYSHFNKTCDIALCHKSLEMRLAIKRLHVGIIWKDWIPHWQRDQWQATDPCPASDSAVLLDAQKPHLVQRISKACGRCTGQGQNLPPLLSADWPLLPLEHGCRTQLASLLCSAEDYRSNRLSEIDQMY